MHLRLANILYILLLCLLNPAHALSATIKGFIYDRATGSPLADATIYLEGENRYTLAGLNGSFTIKNVTAGVHTVVIRYVSFKTYIQTIKIKPDEIFNMEVSLEPNSQRQLKEITVTAEKTDSGEKQARSLEQSAPQIMNIVSSQAIKVSPDLTVASLIQRVSGVSLERNNTGNGQYAILRGMDKRYNYTLLNGVKIPSPDKQFRYVPLDIFPSELLKRLEVYKTLTPDMEGDAVGGVVNMVTKEAPDTLSVSANLAGGYNAIFLDRSFMRFNHKEINGKSPYQLHSNPFNAGTADFSTGPLDYRFSHPAPDLHAWFSAGDRFLKKKLGLLFTGNVQNTFKGNNSLFFDLNIVDTLRGVTLTDMKQRNYSERELSYTLYSQADYRLNGRNKIQWNNLFLNTSRFQVRDSRTTFLTIGGYDAAKGNANLQYDTRSRTTKQNIYNSTLQGNHQLTDNLRLNWSAVYSIANNDQPDNTTVSLNGEEANFIASRTTVERANRRWERNTDRDLAGYLNIKYLSCIATIPVEWETGGLYRNKLRSNFYDNYQFISADPYATYGADFNDYRQIQWIVENPRGSIGTPLNYKAFEKTAAGFFQFRTSGKQLEITGGLRIENMDQGYKLDYPVGEIHPSGKQVYTEVLPSLHLRFMPAKKINIRSSYFCSINRPGFFEIVPYTIVNEDYVERGDPGLKHAIADNIDIRFESYYPHAGQFMAALFYKHIKNPIEYALKFDSIRGQDIYYMPGNFGNAVNYGGEIDFIKYFNRIGIKVNYSYTHSRIRTGKSKRIRDENGDLKTISVSETRPLYGQAAHISNISVLYKDPRRRWDAQLAVQYTGDRINTVSQFVGNDLWQKAIVQMDASFEKNFSNGFGFFAKAYNLLNTPMIVYIKNTSPKNVGVPYQSLNGKTLICRND